jgi:hypothetical protein
MSERTFRNVLSGLVVLLWLAWLFVAFAVLP